MQNRKIIVLGIICKCIGLIWYKIRKNPQKFIRKKSKKRKLIINSLMEKNKDKNKNKLNKIVIGRVGESA